MLSSDSRGHQQVGQKLPGSDSLGRQQVGLNLLGNGLRGHQQVGLHQLLSNDLRGRQQVGHKLPGNDSQAHHPLRMIAQKCPSGPPRHGADKNGSSTSSNAAPASFPRNASTTSSFSRRSTEHVA